MEKTRCTWCSKTYTTAGAYYNHLSAKHKYSHKSQLQQPLPRRKNRNQQSQLCAEISYLPLEPLSPSRTSSTPQRSADAARPLSSSTEDFPRKYQAGAILTSEPQTSTQPDSYPYHPFQTIREYKLARFFCLGKVPKSRVDEFFKDNLLGTSSVGLPTKSISFNSAHTLYKQIDKMLEDPSWITGEVEYPLRPKAEFFFRNIIDCTSYLLRQRAYIPHLDWSPVRKFNADGEREFSELNTANWWWDTQVRSIV